MPFNFISAPQKNAWQLSSDFQFASNALTTGLAKTYYLKGFISDDMKDDVSKNLADKNRLGGEFSQAFYYRHKPDTLFGRTDLSWFIGIKNVNEINSTFSRDLFEVYFRGNKNYGGKTAYFSGFNYRLLNTNRLSTDCSKQS